MAKEKIFNDNSYYRWLKDRGEIYIRHDDAPDDFVESGQVFKGSCLNSASNLDELSKGCRVNWLELPSVNGLDPTEVNSCVERLTMEQCFDLMPNPKENSQGYYPMIKGLYIENGGKWEVRVNDWYGDRSQVEVFVVRNENLLTALHSAVLMMAERDMIRYCKIKEIFKKEG